jgi:hypothetical protein
MVTTTDCVSGCTSRSLVTTSTPDPSGRPRSTRARSNFTAVTRASASATRALSEICEHRGTPAAPACAARPGSRAGLRAEGCSSWGFAGPQQFMLSAYRPRFRALQCAVEWKREAYHGSEAGPRFDQALPLHLLGALLHRGHAVAAVESAVGFAADAVAVVLHHQLEVAVGHLAAHAAERAPLCLMMLLVASRRMRVVCT